MQVPVGRSAAGAGSSDRRARCRGKPYNKFTRAGAAKGPPPPRWAGRGCRVSLTDLSLPTGAARLPGDVRSFLREAERRVRQLRPPGHVPGFVPSDFAGAYAALRALAEAGAAPGDLFCEWGSGLGVVACLAAMLDFDACGIEAEGELVDAARRLADDFGLPVEFVRGNFIPPGGGPPEEAGGGFAWLTTAGGDPREELGLGPEDFAVIYAYPWPDEEELTAGLFERHAGAGAVLVTYHGGADFRLRQKCR